MQIFRNATVVLPDRLCPQHSVVVEDSRIMVIAPDDAVAAQGEVIDCRGKLLGPGFIDIHCHAGGDIWVDQDPVGAAEHQLWFGTTSMLATTVSAPTATLVEALQRISNAIDAGMVPTIRGIHMEGPYINPALGAHRDQARGPEIDDYLAFVEAAHGSLKAMTIAPEIEGTDQMVRVLSHTTGGRIIFSVGHSAATPDQVSALVPSGLRLATHVTNASGCPSGGEAGTRTAGLDEAVWLDDAIFAEVIADSAGRHVSDDMLRLVVKIKGIDKIVLITDATGADGPRRAADTTDIRLNSAGELAGSALTMEAAVQNFVRNAGVSIVDAWRCASYNPASAHGWLNTRGWVAPGRRADLVLMDDELRVNGVWLGGEKVTKKP